VFRKLAIRTCTRKEQLRPRLQYLLAVRLVSSDTYMLIGLGLDAVTGRVVVLEVWPAERVDKLAAGTNRHAATAVDSTGSTD
jgi:hypothetical protein